MIQRTTISHFDLNTKEKRISSEETINEMRFIFEKYIKDDKKYLDLLRKSKFEKKFKVGFNSDDYTTESMELYYETFADYYHDLKQLDSILLGAPKTGTTALTTIVPKDEKLARTHNFVFNKRRLELMISPYHSEVRKYPNQKVKIYAMADLIYLLWLKHFSDKKIKLLITGRDLMSRVLSGYFYRKYLFTMSIEKFDIDNLTNDAIFLSDSLNLKEFSEKVSKNFINSLETFFDIDVDNLQNPDFIESLNIFKLEDGEEKNIEKVKNIFGAADITKINKYENKLPGYSEFIKAFKIDKKTIDEIYDLEYNKKYMELFYSKDEIKKFKESWYK